MSRTFDQLLAEPSGAIAIEYGLICALIALAIIAAVGTTGEQLIASLNSLLDYF